MARPTGLARARTHTAFRLISIEGAERWEDNRPEQRLMRPLDRPLSHADQADLPCADVAFANPRSVPYAAILRR